MEQPITGIYRLEICTGCAYDLHMFSGANDPNSYRSNLVIGVSCEEMCNMEKAVPR